MDYGPEGELIPSEEDEDDDDDMPDLDEPPVTQKKTMSDAEKADKFNAFMKAQNDQAEANLIAKLKKEGKF